MDTELSALQVPQSLEAEQSVLGSIIIDSRCVADVVGVLTPDDFYLQQNREMFEAMYTMFNYSQTIDPVTLLDKLREMGYYTDQSYDYVKQLMAITPTAANVMRYAQIVREKAMLRRLGQAADEISQSTRDQLGTPEEILETAEKKIYALRKGENRDSLEHVGTILHKVFARLNELSQSDSAIPGMSTGLADLDSKINGLNNSDLLLVAARPAMGKSAFALNLGLNVAKNTKKTVAIFNLEMSREQMVMRLLATESSVDGQKMATGKLDDAEWTRLTNAASALSQTDIRIDDNPMITPAQISAKCRRLDNLALVVIDYLQLMSSSEGRSSDNRVTEVGAISRALKVMAKELNVPVICLSQLSRAVEGRSDKRPILSDLRESGAIEQDADCVMFLYRDEYYNENSDEKGVAECIVAKNRHGETGKVKLQWHAQYQLFSNLSWKHD